MFNNFLFSLKIYFYSSNIILVNIIQPGVSANLETEITTEPILERENVGLSELIKSLISPNIIHAASNTQLLPIIVFWHLRGL